ncbi:MAG: ABC transporter permease [Rhodobacteraceae bacterium]|nr:ABC transporter permease [Paracoccaceae bacterium]
MTTPRRNFVRHFLHEPATFGLSLLGFVGLWWALALLKADPQVLPAPPEVMADIVKEAQSGDLAYHMLATLRRVILAFGVAMVAGAAIGLLLGRRPGLARWLDPWVTVLLNLPALVIIVLCYLWIGLNETAAITAVALNKTAMVVVSVREGVRSVDPALDEMGRLFRMGPVARLRHILLPQLAPFIAASARNGLAVIWKIVLVVEFLGRSSGVGFQIHLYFQLFDVAMVLAYALSFVAVMLLVELLLIQPLEARAGAWRRRAAPAV